MPSSSSAPPSSSTPKANRWTLPLILIAQFVTPMSIAGTAVALPQISTDLGSDTTALHWVVNGFNVAFALAVLIWGALSDRIGYKFTFVLGGLFFGISSLISAVSPSLFLLDAMRVVAGLGAAAVLTGSSALISSTYGGAARARAFAIFGTVNGLGLALGPTISGVLVSTLDWRGVFAVHGIALLAIVACSRTLPMIPITANHANASRPPLLDLALLRNREFLAMCLVPVAGSIGFVTFLTYLPSALSGIRALSAGEAGMTMLAMTIPVVLAPTIVAKMVKEFHSVTVGTVVYASFSCLILGGLGLLLLTENGSIAWIVLPMILLGIGFGAPIGLVDSHALGVVPLERTGTAAGLLNFFRIGSEAIFVAGYAFLLSTLIGQQLTGQDATETAAGQPKHPEIYLTAFTTTVITLVVLIAIVATLFIALRRSHSSTSENC